MKQFLFNAFQGSFLEKFLIRLVKYLVKNSLDGSFNPHQIFREHYVHLHNETLKKGLLNIGESICFYGKVTITNPEFVVIGNNVHIDDNAYFDTIGGLTIGDNTHISRNVTIYTYNHDYTGTALPYDEGKVLKSVHIGKNVWIGMNVSIVPGVRIGEGAIIGLGTVVTKDVPPYAIVGQPPSRISGERNIEHYQDHLKKEAYGGVNGKLLSTEQKQWFKENAASKGENLVFVASTGRAGSTSIAKILSQHSQIESYHEPHGQLISLSTQYAHGEKSREQVKCELESIFLHAATFTKGKVYIESDQKISNLISIITEILPGAKFIWLLRNAKTFVNSSYPRGWFSKDEKDKVVNEYYKQWLTHRIDGFKCGEFSSEQWNDMSVFERNCWYWTYWNKLIESQLINLPREQYLQLKLENLDHDLERICDFLHLPSFSFEVKKYNRAYYNVLEDKDWDNQMKLQFNKWCTYNLKRWYGIEVAKLEKEPKI